MAFSDETDEDRLPLARRRGIDLVRKKRYGSIHAIFQGLGLGYFRANATKLPEVNDVPETRGTVAHVRQVAYISLVVARVGRTK